MDKINWGPIGKEVYERTYPRVKEDGEKENWSETTERVINGNLSLVPRKFIERNEKEKLKDLMLKFAVIPAGRHLWTSGVPGRQFLSNCHVSGWTKNIEDHYTFLFDELMKGGGVGTNYNNRYIKHYKAVQAGINLHIVCDPKHADFDKMKDYLSDTHSHEWPGCIPIEDSREGWVDALKILLQTAFGKQQEKTTIVFDMSRIRPYGSPIRGFGGIASGPSALAEMLTLIAELLQQKYLTKLTSLDHMNIDDNIAHCVRSGNVRRSARISVKYWKDEDILEFINCKQDKERRAHTTTNISVEIDNAFLRAIKKKDVWAKKVYKQCINGIHNSGEPGFWNISLSQIGEIDSCYAPNPCSEIILNEWGSCNLGHVNLDHFYDDHEGAKSAFRLMTRFLIRATFGDINSSLQRDVIKKNRRIGVGFFGYHGWSCKQGIRYSESHQNHDIKKKLREYKNIVREEARDYCFQLRIPECIKVTAVAPTGTIAKLPGKSEGAQAIMAKYFIRIVRFSSNDPKLKDFKKKGHFMEPCVYTKDTTAVYFYCRDKLVEELDSLGLNEDLIEDQYELSIEDALAVQSMIQREYADNSISFTVNLPKSTHKKKLYHVILRYLPDVKGTTVILGDGGRKQTPYTKISKEEFEAYTGPRMISQGTTKCRGNVCPAR